MKNIHVFFLTFTILTVSNSFAGPGCCDTVCQTPPSTEWISTCFIKPGMTCKNVTQGSETPCTPTEANACCAD